MLPQSFFVPLYFDEAEADLWQALQQIEPEKRSAFIKASLRQVLFNENRIEILDVPSSEHEQENAEDELENDLEEIETFSLEDLFAEVPGGDPEAETEDSQVAAPASGKLPWNHLLQSVIGVEEDESVIAAIKQAFHYGVREEKSDSLTLAVDRSEFSLQENDEQGDQLAEEEFDFESLQVDTPIPSAGFEYLMKHIIGTEDDETILMILREGSLDKEE